MDGAPCTPRAAGDGEEKATRGHGNGGGDGISQSCFCEAHARSAGGSCPPGQSPWDGVWEAQTLTVVFTVCLLLFQFKIGVPNSRRQVVTGEKYRACVVLVL